MVVVDKSSGGFTELKVIGVGNNEDEVSIQSYGTGDVHKPAHAHVKGGGKESA